MTQALELSGNGGWPVISEESDLVILKLRIEIDSVWVWSPWPSNNAQMRTNLEQNPQWEAIFAINLINGSKPFIINTGGSGWANSTWSLSSVPSVMKTPEGDEVAITTVRGSPCIQNPCDGRWDAHVGEIMLSDNSVVGYRAGEVRFIQNTFFPTDEAENISTAGKSIYGGHWMFGSVHEIKDRGYTKGSTTNKITTTDLPHITTSASNCGFSTLHFCSDHLDQDGDSRILPYGFYIYFKQGSVYDRFWSDYATWVIGNDLILFRSSDGAIIALEKQ